MNFRIARMEFRLSWSSGPARHTEVLHAPKVSFWRDIFPPEFEAGLADAGPGTRVECRLPEGDPVPGRSEGKMRRLAASQFDRTPGQDVTIDPRTGGFYPLGLLKDVPGVFKANTQPFRLIGLGGDAMTVDLNHPLAGRDLVLAGTVLETREEASDVGGRCTEWARQATLDGPGMQARIAPDTPTRFLDGDPFARLDPRDDAAYFADPRMVPHVDSAALGVLEELYGELLPPGGAVLDLMASWDSHLPEGFGAGPVAGLGLNAEELDRNPRLDERVIHDLNADPRLPFGDGRFDAVVCALSVDYLVRPLEVFAEVRRVLRPGGLFLATFSHRWFPPKVVQVWKDLHPFERMGLVLEYFHGSGSWTGLETRSVRGLPRPGDDPYFPRLTEADPLFAVRGIRPS